jgi:pimeloyl-ACP methyl ester carboxylesterase
MLKIKTGHADVNGARLYYEVRGEGPTLLLVSGATGDAGHFTAVADALADTSTVVTYDRRGNSRSPRPAGWASTSMREQAEDAAALLASLGAAPAAVFGTSGGALVACELLLRRPDVVRGAVLHEPPLAAVVPAPQGEAGARELEAMIAGAMERGGPPAAVEAFVRDAAGDAFDAIPQDVRARMMGNGETLLGRELAAFLSYVPDERALAANRRPVRVLVGERTTPFFAFTTQWLASRVGTTVATLPGGHTPYFDRPHDTAAALRRLFDEVP